MGVIATFLTAATSTLHVLAILCVLVFACACLFVLLVLAMILLPRKWEWFDGDGPTP